MTHEIFVKTGKHGVIRYVTCLTCNISYPGAEQMLKEHINIELEKVHAPDFECAICHLPIKREEIPKEYFEKIATQLLYHNDCVSKVQK